MIIWDCFTFFNEKDLLEIRCEELKELDVTHILVEATTTFTGVKKELNYLENKETFSKYNIKHFITDSLPNNGNAWDNEKEQRNYIKTALQISGAKDDDLVIISDIDEIVSADAIKNYSPNNNLTAVRIDTYRYYLNCLEARQNWIMPRIMKYSHLKDKTPDSVRNSGYEHIIDNGGWHFSYQGGVEMIKKKIESFSHIELNTDKFKDKLQYKYDNCQSLFGDDYWTVENLDNLPKCVSSNPEKYSHLIYNK